MNNGSKGQESHKEKYKGKGAIPSGLSSEKTL